MDVHARKQLSFLDPAPARFLDRSEELRVGLKKATPGIDSVNGMTSRVTPHCFRRAWATIALNDEKNPTPIDVVSEVLRHKEIATTRRHYAPTKSDRARAALIAMKVA
ncbi:MAG TPA: hypothetical protein VLK37_07250 [Solirubrobacterales bacterium]|nr:hypothetical protein [Solirubrobacterales bacterium]